jgi:hypothetical protein
MIVVRLIGAVLLFCALTAPARSEESKNAEPTPAVVDATALADAYFDEAERFDGFRTYEVKRGPASALFTIAQRWRDGLAELIVDIREPEAFSKWALLLQQNRGGSDDLFAYIDKTGSILDRGVRRFAAAQIERHAFFDLLAVGDYRPTPRGELVYEAGADERLDGVPCHLVIATTPKPYLGFDRVELAFAADTGLLLESRFMQGDRETRRLTTAPGDFKDVGGRRLPFRRIAHSWADDGETEILLQRVVETPDLPDGLFSHLNLRVQHFPQF